MPKIFVLGSKSFVASHLPYEKISDRLTPDYLSIGALINHYKPDILINCIGFCGSPSIDQCETKQAETFNTNTVLPVMLANECYQRDIRLINIGSGCIFSKASPHKDYSRWRPCVRSYDDEIEFSHERSEYPDLGWRETDPANPPSLYSKSKYACDLLLENYKNTTTLRIRMPLSEKNHPRNLLNKLLQYRKIVEELNSITWMQDLSRSVEHAITKELSGVFHCTNSEPIKHSRILDEYKKYYPEYTYEKISANDLDLLTSAKRSNCILDNTKLRATGFEFTPIEEAIKMCVEGFVKNV